MPPAIYRVGAPAALGDFSVTLDQAKLVTDAKGGRTITIHYTIRNISPTPAPLARMPAFHLQDSAGHSYAAITGPRPAERQLAPGEARVAAVSFRVPKAAADPLAWLLMLGSDQAPGITLR